MPKIITFILFVLALLIALLIARAAIGTPSVSSASVIAQACYLEATWNHRDCSAISHVLVRRAKRIGWTVERMAYAYSLNKNTPRAAYARGLPNGLGDKGLIEWRKLVEVVQGVLDGRIKDPCRGRPTQWGSPHPDLPDPERAAKAVAEGRWVEARCGKVANRFYIERRAPKTVSAAVAAGRK